ncbi:MAG: SMP-30/gluconolactonase/LRE family protein [Caulobacterales bacterium]|nr:SMP-30/gluconolactonase/LRE family protein [Caulobacterales bacterium]
MTDGARLIETIEVGDRLGEGVLWRDSDQTVWWTDILARRLHVLEWPSLALRTRPTPERLCSFAFIEGRDDIILAAFESGFALYDPVSGERLWLDRPAGLGPDVRLNDGRVDPGGRFWCGSMVERPLAGGEAAPGVLYRLEPDGRAAPVLGRVRISNGLCWSPDGARMHFADSGRGEIYAGPFDADSGVPGRLEPFARIDGASPDGAVVDAEGRLWSALWGGARVERFTSDGTGDGAVEVPAPQPTCPALGGPRGNLLFVTSARDGLSEAALAERPASGALFVFETAARAAPSPRARLAPDLLDRWSAEGA